MTDGRAVSPLPRNGLMREQLIECAMAVGGDESGGIIHLTIPPLIQQVVVNRRFWEAYADRMGLQRSRPLYAKFGNWRKVALRLPVVAVRASRSASPLAMAMACQRSPVETHGYLDASPERSSRETCVVSDGSTPSEARVSHVSQGSGKGRKNGDAPLAYSMGRPACSSTMPICDGCELQSWDCCGRDGGKAYREGNKLCLEICFEGRGY